MTNNAMNIPYLDTFGYVLIGTGTRPVVGSILGDQGIVVTPTGTAIRIASTSSLTNTVESFPWGSVNGIGVEPNTSSFCSSFIGSFTGNIVEIETYWTSIGTSNSFNLSIWRNDKSTMLARTASFVPTLGTNILSFQTPASITPGILFWVQLRPESATGGGTWRMYGMQTQGTNRTDFNVWGNNLQGQPQAFPGYLATAVRGWWLLS